jgi:hypothetical protein
MEQSIADYGTLLAVVGFIAALIVHSVMLGRWGGRLTEKVTQTQKEVSDLERGHLEHAERIRMVENAVVRFEEAVRR